MQSLLKLLCFFRNSKLTNIWRDFQQLQLMFSLGVDLIIVTGPTGSGRSSFLKAVTGYNI